MASNDPFRAYGRAQHPRPCASERLGEVHEHPPLRAVRHQRAVRFDVHLCGVLTGETSKEVAVAGRTEEMAEPRPGGEGCASRSVAGMAARQSGQGEGEGTTGDRAEGCEGSSGVGPQPAGGAGILFCRGSSRRYGDMSGNGQTYLDLIAAWRGHAADIEAYASQAAAAFRRAADQLEAVAAGSDSEALTLEAAATESGYSLDHLGRMIRDGKLANAGRKHAPRVRRCDLPRKPSSPRHSLPAGKGSTHLVGADPRRVARDLVTASKKEAV